MLSILCGHAVAATQGCAGVVVGGVGDIEQSDIVHVPGVLMFDGMQLTISSGVWDLLSTA